MADRVAKPSTRTRPTGAFLAALTMAFALVGCSPGDSKSGIPEPPATVGAPIQLPSPGALAMPLGEAIDARHSVRSFADHPLSSDDLATLLWAGYGFRSDGGRTVPSAGGLYALTLFAVVGRADGIDPGSYVWDPVGNELGLIREGELRRELQAAALEQTSVGEAPVVLVVAGSPSRLADRYGNRAEQYTLNEAGHASQNILLGATALGLGAVAVGGFQEAAVTGVLYLPDGEVPYYLIPVGSPGS